ncbi:DUF3108 domain-containing protein [Sneathiella aquimaris]|uniref:DUF3108 domain-containing protein n=1 Tax=Sneathiella aquimaris TaxID=2599305 RepID=UPI001469ACA0|nr:DUF3108 domain-containing protein [Sneathiella aquimaris]
MVRRLVATGSLPVFIFSMLTMSFATETSANEPLRLKHSVYLGGLYLGSVKTDVREAGNTYAIMSEARSNSSLTWMFEWIANATSSGTVFKNKVVPDYHFHQSAWNDKKRGATLTFDADGDVKAELVGKKNTNLQKYTPLPKDGLRNSVDPMSMILSAVLSYETDNRCDGYYPVFDGRRRYDVKLTDAGEKVFKPSKYSVFSGKASGCRINIIEKGGFKRDADYKLDEDEELIVWVAKPVEDGRPVPVRMQVQTDLGSMEMHLEKYTDGRVQLASKSAR